MSVGKRAEREKKEAKRSERFVLVGASQAQLADTLNDPRFDAYDAKGLAWVNGHFFVLMQTKPLIEKRR